jgi:hypothetical protein
LKLDKIGPKEFKFEEIECNITDYAKRRAMPVQRMSEVINSILSEYFKNFKYQNESNVFIAVTSIARQTYHHVGVESEDFTDYYHYRFFYIDFLGKDSN